jgi:hypothetical protein
MIESGLTKKNDENASDHSFSKMSVLLRINRQNFGGFSLEK